MDFRPILTAALMIGGMGLIFGALLAIVGASSALRRIPARRRCANACPGRIAAAAVSPVATPTPSRWPAARPRWTNAPVGGDSVAQAIAKVMGVEAGKREKRIATVRCRGSPRPL